MERFIPTEHEVIEGPCQFQGCSSSHSCSSNSGSNMSYTGNTQSSPLVEYILNLPEEDWIVFSSLLNSQMTKAQFANLCLTILKVVSLSSVAVIIPVYSCVVKDAQASSRGSPSSSNLSGVSSNERSSSTSCDSSVPTYQSCESERTIMDSASDISCISIATNKPIWQPMQDKICRLKSTMGTLRRTVAWYPDSDQSQDSGATAESSESETSSSTSEDDTSKTSSVTTLSDPFHDLMCVNTVLEDLLSNGNIPKIAKKLVDQVQAILQDNSLATAGKDVQGSGLPLKTLPKRTLSATEMVYGYAEDAIKTLLEPYLLPLVTLNTGRETGLDRPPYASMQSPESYEATSESSPSPSLLGLAKMQCSCLLTKLMQKLPANIAQRTRIDPSGAPNVSCRQKPGVSTSMSHKLKDMMNLFTQVMACEVLDIVDDELVPFDDQQPVISTDASEASRKSGSVDEVDAEPEGLMVDKAPFSCFVTRFLGELKYTDSAISVATVSRDTSLADGGLSVQSDPISNEPKVDVDAAPQKLRDMITLFTRVLVHQVMDILHMESNAEQYKCQSSATPHLEQPLFAGNGSNASSDFSVSTSDKGCLVTVLLLKQLVKIAGDQSAPANMREASQEIIDKLLSELSCGSKPPSFLTYSSNLNLQAIYRAIDKFLLDEVGAETILQRASNTDDLSFDTLLLNVLREQLLSPRVPSPPAASGAPSGARDSPAPPSEDRHTDSVKWWRWKWIFKKRPRFCWKQSSLVTPTADDGVPASHVSTKVVSAASGNKQETKRNPFLRMITCCFKGSSET